MENIEYILYKYVIPRMGGGGYIGEPLSQNVTVRTGFCFRHPLEESWTRWECHSGSIGVCHVHHSDPRDPPWTSTSRSTLVIGVPARPPQVWTKLVIHPSFEFDAADTHVIPEVWLSLDLLTPRWDGLRQPCALVPVEATNNSHLESPSRILCLRVNRTLFLSTPPPPGSSERWLSRAGSFIPQICSSHLLRVVMRFGWQKWQRHGDGFWRNLVGCRPQSRI